MVAAELEGDTLGQKHREYNATLKELVSNNTSPDTLEDNDINNLLKIEIASRNKDVDYILQVLKGEDLLYVSKAISLSKWLILDEQYANIINPEYLQSELFPNMTTKAVIMLKKFIRHNIKDETRAEQFYLNEKDITDAIKWLPHCSVEFINKNVPRHVKSSRKDMELRMFKRLCERSTSIFETMINNLECYQVDKYLRIVTFLFNTDMNKYLDVLDKYNYNFRYEKLSPKSTELIMKHCPDRIKDNFHKYISMIHMPTFVKCLKADEIKTFIYTQVNKDLKDGEYRSLRNLFYVDTLKQFIKRLPKDEQFDFIEHVCAGKELEDIDKEILSTDTGAVRLNKLCYSCNHKPYVWYQFAPFPLAYEQLTKLYSVSADLSDKRQIICILIKSANHNLEHIADILKYYKKHGERDPDGIFEIVTNVLEHTRITKYDDTTWNLLNDLLISAKLYEEYDYEHEQIIDSVIIYNLLKGNKVPEVIEKKFQFRTMESYRSQLNQEQQDKVFDYLYNYIVAQIKDPISNEDDFNQSVETLITILKLLQAWNKSLLEFPLILTKIREYIKLKKENSWKISLSPLYNVNKSWRKHMFEESLVLCPSEEVCLNALKHEPQLLSRYMEEVDALRTDDKASLRRMQRKLRLYWQESLAQEWIKTYMDRIDKTNGQKAAVQGLCRMLAQKPLLDIIEKYKPTSPKIDWKVMEEHVLNVQRILAKNMHTGRPQPNPDIVLSYAKGDYLQFTLPSLLAVFYNLKHVLNKQYIPKLLDAPVSLQKHGIRFAFKKLDRDELKKIFLDCWKTSKNVSIRAIIFKYTFTLLCSEKDEANAASLWELLELFIENLTFTEDKDTYKLLSNDENVPSNIRGKFIIKSYEFLRKLIPTLDESNQSSYEWFCANLAEHSREVMDTISTDFVLKIIHEFIENDFINYETKFVRSVHYSDGIISVISAYLLCTIDENEQMQRYEKVMVPLLKRSFEKWNEKRDGKFFIRNHFQHLLTRLTLDLKGYVTEKKKNVPVKMFSLIKTELDNTLKVSENYMMLTKWKLTVTLATLAEKYSSSEVQWYDQCGSEFGKICLDYLREDVTTHFPCIYLLFSKSVRNIIDDFLPSNTALQFYEIILSDQDFIQGYLAAIELTESKSKEDYKVIHKQIFSHPSIEVKMHYYSKINKPEIGEHCLYQA